jgi:hypothetical protein
MHDMTKQTETQLGQAFVKAANRRSVDSDRRTLEIMSSES